MESTSHEEMKALVAAYVLGSVPEAEEPTVRAHLLTCEECMTEVDTHAEAVARLAFAVEPEPLVPGFEESVLARVAAEGAVPKPAPLRRRFGLGWAAALASLVVALGAGTAYLSIRNDLERERRITSVLLRSDEGMRLGGEGVAAMVPAGGGAVFVAEGLADPPAERVYQLWLLRSGEPVSAGTFEVEDGRAVVETDRSIEGFDGAAVTIEPAGGSDAPTTEPVLRTT